MVKPPLRTKSKGNKVKDKIRGQTGRTPNSLSPDLPRNSLSLIPLADNHYITVRTHSQEKCSARNTVENFGAKLTSHSQRRGLILHRQELETYSLISIPSAAARTLG